MKEEKQRNVLFLQLNGKILHLAQFWKFLCGWRKFSFKLVILQMPLFNNDPGKRGVINQVIVENLRNLTTK
jgi:hypothetical protein